MQPAAPAPADYSSPTATYRTFLNAVKRDDVAGAIACWTISDGNKSGALDILVGVWVTTHKFGKTVRSRFKDLEGTLVRMDCTDEAIDLTLTRLEASKAEISEDKAGLRIKWQEEDGYPSPAFFFSSDPIPFRRIDGGWKIDANVHGNLPSASSAISSTLAGSMGRAMEQSMSMMNRVIGEVESGKVTTSAQFRQAMSRSADSISAPRPLAFEEMEALYYRVDASGKKAYLFFSQPDYIIVGGPCGWRKDGKVEKITFSFVGIRNTEANRKRYDTAKLMNATLKEGLWVKEYDIGRTTNWTPQDTLKMYYGKPGSPGAVEIPRKP